MKKKVFLFLMIFAIVASQVFAADTITVGDGTTGFEINSLARMVTLMTGIIPGVLIAIKFMYDVVVAYFSRDVDPHKMKNAIIGFAIVVLVILGYVVVVNFVFADDATNETGSAVDREDFFTGVKGAEIPAEYLTQFGDYEYIE